MCDFTGFIKISKRSKVQPYTVPIQYTVYGYGPKATILTKLTTTAASTTDSYKTHFLKNNIQTSYQVSLWSSMILLRSILSQNPQPTNKEGCEIAYLNFHLLIHFECDSTCPSVCVFLILPRDVFISANSTHTPIHSRSHSRFFRYDARRYK